MLEAAIGAATLAVALHTLVKDKHARAKEKKAKEEELRKEDLRRLRDLRREVLDNLEILKWFDRKGTDLTARMAYDPATRAQLKALQNQEIHKAREDIDCFLRMVREPVTEKSLPADDPLRVFWVIKDADDMLHGLAKRLERQPPQYAPRAPAIILKRRIPALQKKLETICKALAAVPEK